MFEVNILYDETDPLNTGVCYNNTVSRNGIDLVTTATGQRRRQLWLHTHAVRIQFLFMLFLAYLQLFSEIPSIFAVSDLLQP